MNVPGVSMFEILHIIEKLKSQLGAKIIGLLFSDFFSIHISIRKRNENQTLLYYFQFSLFFDNQENLKKK